MDSPQGKVVAIVGMPGSGKSVAAKVFADAGWPVVRLGDITEEEMQRRGLHAGEQSERTVRESLRQEFGMAAFAIRNMPRIEKAIQDEHRVVIDGMYSMEEYECFQSHFHQSFHVLGIIASPAVRHARLARRSYRPLTAQEAVGRDFSEIKNLNKGGPIALADSSLINESSEEEFRAAILALAHKF